MDFFIQHHVIVSHVKMNNCWKLKYSNGTQGFLNVWNSPRVTLDYFAKLSEVSYEYYYTIFIEYNKARRGPFQSSLTPLNNY